jgi:hypothetical protein
MPPAQERTHLLEDALSALYAAPPSYEELLQQRFMDDVKAQDDKGGSERQPLKWRNILLIALVHVLGFYGLVFGLLNIKISSLIMSECLAKSLNSCVHHAHIIFSNSVWDSGSNWNDSRCTQTMVTSLL